MIGLCTWQDFCAFIAVPEQVVELRTAAAPLGCLQGSGCCPLQGSAALCPSGLYPPAFWGSATQGFWGKALKQKSKM